MTAHRDNVVQLPVLPRFVIALMRWCHVCDGEMPTDHICRQEARA